MTTYLIDPARLASALTSRTRAVLPVHLYGRVCNMDAINAFAKEHGLKVVDDVAQAHVKVCELLAIRCSRTIYRKQRI